MAYEIPGFSWTLVAAEDLTDSQFCAVNVNSAGKAALPVQGARVVGVLRNKPDVNENATIVSSGIVMAKVGITGVHAGDNVTCDDDGTIIQATSGNRTIGVALITAVAGGVTSVLLQIGNAQVAGS